MVPPGIPLLLTIAERRTRRARGNTGLDTGLPGCGPCPRRATTWRLWRFGRDPDLVYDTPRVRAVSRVRRWRIIQAAERARQAIAHGATGCAVVSGVIAASSASKAVSQMANSMIWLRKPRRWRAGGPGPRGEAGARAGRRYRRGAWR